MTMRIGARFNSKLELTERQTESSIANCSAPSRKLCVTNEPNSLYNPDTPFAGGPESILCASFARGDVSE